MSGVGRRDRATTGLRMARCRRVGQTRCGGFSYLWLLLLLAFIGVGLAVAAQLHATAVQRQCEQELLAIGWQFRTALGRYHEAQQVAGKKEYPPSLEDLLQDPRFPGIERPLRKIFVDPITRKKQWGTLKIGGRVVGVHSLSEAATLKSDGFEPRAAPRSLAIPAGIAAACALPRHETQRLHLVQPLAGRHERSAAKPAETPDRAAQPNSATGGAGHEEMHGHACRGNGNGAAVPGRTCTRATGQLAARFGGYPCGCGHLSA